MSKQILVTGGASFIGSHVAYELQRGGGGYAVRALDNLSPKSTAWGRRGLRTWNPTSSR